MQEPSSNARDRPDRLKRDLQAIAHALGFDAVRVAPSGPAPHADRFLDWIADRCHGDMDWLARAPERRTDPAHVLPGVESVVVLATNYLSGPVEAGGSPGGRRAGRARGVIARYARGDDYHELIESRLRDLDVWLADQGGSQRCYVDTGPVLERDFASLAGLGWNGKSTVQIDRRLGTWFFLSVILTTLRLPPDPPSRDHCGRCTRCIDACPTNAITHPHRVDARRCISYLTIEHRGPIPVEFRRAIGDRIFGCDDCLDVCPWNRFATAGREAAFAARDHVRQFALADYLTLTDDEFRAMFRHSPIKRTGRERFLRNVCVALGNAGDARDLAALESARVTGSPLVAEHAAWAIREICRRIDGPPGEPAR